MFLGTHTPRLDDKGRLFLPAKFRDQLERGLVVTRGQERCLFVFPIAEFEQVTTAMREAPPPIAMSATSCGSFSPVPRTRSPTSRGG